MNVLDLFSGIKPNQALRADNASGRAVHGMSDRVSILVQASCFCWIARRHCGDAPVCELRQELGSPRTIGKRVALRDGGHRSASSCRQAQASLWILHNILSAYSGFWRRISSGSGAHSSANTQESNASDWHRLPFFRPQKLVRTVCNVAETCAQVFVAAIEPSANKRPNTIWRSLDRHQKLFRSVRNVGVFSCLK